MRPSRRSHVCSAVTRVATGRNSRRPCHSCDEPVLLWQPPELIRLPVRIVVSCSVFVSRPHGVRAPAVHSRHCPPRSRTEATGRGYVMSAMNPGNETGGVVATLSRLGLAEQTRDFGGPASATIAQAYIQFRRSYYNETNPTLDSVPPQNSEIRRTQAGAIAERTLSLIPRAFRQLPLLRDIFNHLQWEVDIHSLTEQERIELHNMAMVFLHGVQNGIQPWYVAWALSIMEALQEVDHPDYYLAFPWQGLFYRSPDELVAIQRAVTSGDVVAIQREIERLGNGLTE